MIDGDLPEVNTRVGEKPGPILALLGGIHGDELEGPLAIRRLMEWCAERRFSGEIRWAAPAHPSAWQAQTRESPVDGQNLARVFPGSADGTATERVAHRLTNELIAGADLLIDLHSAGENFDMPLMAGYVADGSETADRANRAARAFNAPITWEHPFSGGGRSITTAADLEVPAIYVEGRGGGQVRKTDLDRYVEGLISVMEHLQMIPNEGRATHPSRVVHGDGNTDGGILCSDAGFSVTAAEVGDTVREGDLLAEIWSETGVLLSEVHAPHDGVVMLLRRRSRVEAGDGVAIVAREVTR